MDSSRFVASYDRAADRSVTSAEGLLEEPVSKTEGRRIEPIGMDANLEDAARHARMTAGRPTHSSRPWRDHGGLHFLRRYDDARRGRSACACSPGEPIVMNEPVRLYLIRIIDGLEVA
jgi:hypothetical protein